MKPISSHIGFQHKVDSAIKCTQHFEIRLNTPTEAEKIEVFIDFQELPQSSSLLICDFGKSPVTAVIGPKIGVKAPDEIKGKTVLTIGITLSTNSNCQFSVQVFSSESA